jgi:two-component system chemotaxis response regulator CheY
MPKIMTSDDAAFMRMVLKDILTKNGYTDVIEAADGVEAVEKYKTEKPDLVFMDIVMPNKDGMQALKEILEFDSNAKVVMCTSVGQQSVLSDAIKIGAVDFIIKPFNAEKVIEAVKNNL